MKLSEIVGAGVALVTPFHRDGSVDFEALERMIDHVISKGIQNIVSLGTTGESITLTKEERKQVIRFTIEKTAQRVPVIVGLGGNNTAEVIHQMQQFPLEEAVAVLSVSPYYNKPSDEGMYQHYKAVAEASPKPVILYNVPGRTGQNVPPSVILRLAREVENIVALKDASGDMVQCMKVIRHKPADFTVVSGDDLLAMTQIACGAEGVISVAGNLYAEEMHSMIAHALSQNFEEARKLHYRLLPAFQFMFAENNPAGIKSFLAAKGLIEENLRLPLMPVSEDLRKQISDFVKGVEQACL